MFALMLTLCVSAAPVTPAADAVTVRARAALALAFAAPAPPTYAEQFATALRDGKPLVVWVGQPVRPVGGCVCVGCDVFPGADGVAVVVGIPTATGVRRIDLPGRPTDAAVRDAIRQ